MVCLVVSGCGFQLRGSGQYETALTSIYISVSNKYGDLHQNLTRMFARSGVAVADSPAGAAYRLSIDAERVNRRAVATSSTISVSEYELRLEVDMSLSSPAGESVIPLTTLVTERIYTFNPSSLVGSNEEETVLLDEMRQDLVLQIMRRIDARVRSIEATQ
jgi:LPS-assembly lipoprotein